MDTGGIQVMKKLLPFIAVVVAAVAAVLVLTRRDRLHAAAPAPSAGATGDDSRASQATRASQTPNGSPSVGGSTQGRQFGNLTVTFRGTGGTDRVSCGAIQTEFAVTMASGDGRVRWTGQATDVLPRQVPFDGARLTSATLEPDTGLLEPGQVQVIRVRGTFSGRRGQQFYVVVQALNSVGTAGNSIPFTCR
jgi:hypothetical protein